MWFFLKPILLYLKFADSLSSLTAPKKYSSSKNGKNPKTVQHVLLTSEPGYSIAIPLVKAGRDAYADEVLGERGTTKTDWFIVEAADNFEVMAIIKELHIPPRFEQVSEPLIAKLIDDDTNGPTESTFCADYIQVSLK